MEGIGTGERDIQLRAVIKSNLVCGDLSKLEEVIDNLFKDIIDVLENFAIPAALEEE